MVYHEIPLKPAFYRLFPLTGKNYVSNAAKITFHVQSYRITLSQFFAEGKEAVVLTDEQRDLLDQWSILSADQKRALTAVSNKKPLLNCLKATDIGQTQGLPLRNSNKEKSAAKRKFRFAALSFLKLKYNNKILYQFNDRHLSTVAAAGPYFDDTGISAVTVFIFRTDFIKHFFNNILFCNEC